MSSNPEYDEQAESFDNDISQKSNVSGSFEVELTNFSSISDENLFVIAQQAEVLYVEEKNSGSEQEKNCAEVILVNPSKSSGKDFMESLDVRDVVIEKAATRGRPKNSKTTNVIGLRKNKIPKKSTTNTKTPTVISAFHDVSKVAEINNLEKETSKFEVRTSKRKRTENPKYKQDEAHEFNWKKM